MRLLLTVTSCLLVLSLNAQMIGLTVEIDTVFYEATGPHPTTPYLLLFEDLDGYVTYDVYANLTNETDEIIAIYSDVEGLGVAPMFIDAPCGCFNPEFGDVLLGGAQNAAFFPSFPEIEYDTYWTIDLNDLEQSLILNPAYSSASMCSEIIEDGSVFVLPGSAHEAGEDLKIQIAQVTTCGGFSLGACFSVLVGGDNANVQEYCIDENGSGPIEVGEGGTSGCTDANADNYDAEASYSDGSCFYIVLGCTNSEACNYDAESNTDDGSCDYCFCLEGTTWDDSLQGCVIDAANLAANCGYGTFWDEESQTCLVVANCAEDLNEDGVIGVDDLMELLSSYGTVCEEFESEPGSSEFTCGDPMNYHGYDYATVQIGEQCWFAENLRTELYQNGESIAGGLDDSAWILTEDGAVSIYDEGGALESINLQAYGRLYNGYAIIDNRGICPNGWHVSEESEWIALEIELGMSWADANSQGWRGVIGPKMKSSAEDVPSWNGSNSSGFSGLAGGARWYSDASFSYSNTYGYFWASSPNDELWDRVLGVGEAILRSDGLDLSYGFSVRCLKNTE